MSVGRGPRNGGFFFVDRLRLGDGLFLFGLFGFGLFRFGLLVDVCRGLLRRRPFPGDRVVGLPRFGLFFRAKLNRTRRSEGFSVTPVLFRQSSYTAPYFRRRADRLILSSCTIRFFSITTTVALNHQFKNVSEAPGIRQLITLNFNPRYQLPSLCPIVTKSHPPSLIIITRGLFTRSISCVKIEAVFSDWGLFHENRFMLFLISASIFLETDEL